MKRIFVLFLCLTLLICCLAVTASASTYADRWTNVLDYATVNNQGSNYFAVDHNETISLALTGNTIVSDIDLVFRSSTPVSSIVLELDETRSFNLIVESLGSNIYRAYGSASNYGFEDLIFRFKLSNTSNRAYCELLQCRISPQSVDLFNIGATITKETNVDGPSSHSAGGTSAFTFSSAGDWSVIYKFTDWKKFDYINFSFTSSGLVISSVSAKVGSRIVPVNITSFNGADGDDFDKIYNGYLDLYGIEHDQSNSLELFITGYCTNISKSLLMVGFLNGSVIAESPSMFSIIWNSITSGFKTVIQWLRQGFDNVVNAITGSFNGFKQEQTETNDKIDGITDHQPEVSVPPGGDSIGSLNDNEQALMGQVSSGLSDIDSQIFNGISAINHYSFGFACVSIILGWLFNISFVFDLLSISLSLAVIVVLFNVTVMVSNHHSADAKSKGRSKPKYKVRPQVRNKKGG